MNKKLLFTCLLLFSSLCVRAQVQDSLYKILDNEIDDTTLIKVYLSLAKSYINSKADSALSYGLLAYEMAMKEKRLPEKAQAANILGIVYMNKTRHELSLKYYKEAVDLFRTAKDERGVAFAYNNMGSVYYHLKNYDEALKFYLLSLDLKLKLHLLKEASSTFVNIGNIYMKKEQYDSSAHYYEKGLLNAQKNEDSYNTSIGLMNLGEVAYVTKDYRKALIYFNKALDFINSHQKDPYHIANCYYAIGKIYGDTKRFAKAEESILKALKLAESSGLRLLEINIYNHLSQLYENEGQVDKAYVYFKKFHILNDSIFNSGNLKQIEEFKQKYESELKDQQLLEKESRLKREETLRNSFITAFILIGVICIVLYRNINLKIKANRLLRNHQQEIEIHQQVIEKKNEELNRINIDLIKENVFTRYEILKNKVNPHFLFNSLSTLSYLIIKSPAKAIDFVESFSKLYRAILEVETNELITLREELKLVDEYLKLQRLRFLDNLIIEKEIDSNYMEYLLPPFSIQLLIENALKHNVISNEFKLRVRLRTIQDTFEVNNSIQKKNFPEPSTGVGQKNIIDRYKLFTNLKPVFHELEGEYQASIPLIPALNSKL